MTGWNIAQTRDAEIASWASRGDGAIPFICKRECEIFAVSVHRKMAVNARQLGLSPAALYSLEDYLRKGCDELERRIQYQVERIERERLTAEKAKEAEERAKAAFPAETTTPEPPAIGPAEPLFRPADLLIPLLIVGALLGTATIWFNYGDMFVAFIKRLLA